MPRGIPLRYDDRLMALLRSDATTKSIAFELGIHVTMVNKHRRRLGIPKYRRIEEPKVRKPRSKYPYPPRAFWEARTIRQMMEIVGCTRGNAENWARSHGYNMKKTHGRKEWPTDCAWYAERTTEQIAAEIGCHRRHVYSHCKNNGFAYKAPLMSRHDWKANYKKHSQTPKRDWQ